MFNKKKEIKKQCNNINFIEFEPIFSSLILNYIKMNIKKEKSSLKDFISLLETKLIYTVLDLTNGRQKNAAEILGVGTTTLNEKIKRYNISLNDFKPNIKAIVEERIKIIKNSKIE